MEQLNNLEKYTYEYKEMGEAQKIIFPNKRMQEILPNLSNFNLI
jgi:hypothetical protein